jgi:hypothetical protein
VPIKARPAEKRKSGNVKYNIVFGPGGFFTSGTVITASGTSVNYDGNFCDPGYWRVTSSPAVYGNFLPWFDERGV